MNTVKSSLQYIAVFSFLVLIALPSEATSNYIASDQPMILANSSAGQVCRSSHHRTIAEQLTGRCLRVASVTAVA